MTDAMLASGSFPMGTVSALLRDLVVMPSPRTGRSWEGALRPGLVVDKFELQREIGRGGFGVVWAATDRELKRAVAFKAMRGRTDTSLGDERLLHEAETAAALSHPNIVTLLDAGRSENGAYLVMELLRGRTLARRIAEGPLSLAEALRVAIAVARGVAHAHEHGVVHRDLKPDNVFLCDDGQVKVLDLGLALVFGRAPLEGGTPGYMAPEQLEGAPEDTRTDVFALGVILHEMLSGRRPDASPGDGPRAGDAVALPPAAPPALTALVAATLARHPDARPRDAAGVLTQLEAVERNLERASGDRRRRTLPRARAAVAGLLAAGLAGAVGLAAWSARDPDAPPSIAVLPFVDLSPGGDQQYLADGVAEEILATLSRVPGLRVAGRASSFRFRGVDEDPRVVGAALAVSSVLEGSVRRSGDRVRVTAALVDVGSGYRAWSETFDRTVGELFTLEDDIARAVAAGLKVELLAPTPGAGARTASSEAYAHVLRARHLLGLQNTDDGRRRARDELERAMELDPAYAVAPAVLSLAHVSGLRPGPAFEHEVGEARRLADRAIELGPDLPDGYDARFNLRFYVDLDWAAARADLDRARALGADMRLGQAGLLAVLGRLHEAIPIARAAAADDPLAGGDQPLGSYYNAVGELDRARAVLSRALEISPADDRLLRELAFTDLLDGRFEAALATGRRISTEYMRRTVEALALHSLRRDDDARAALTGLCTAPANPYQCAQAHAWRGDTAAAIEALDRAVASRNAGVRHVKYDPLLRSVRAHPGYRAAVAALKLPVD